MRRAAQADALLSISGLLLVLFMWAHMFFVASILISEQAMWTISRMFEGYFLFGKAYPALVSLVVASVVLLIIFHALLALRRYPASYAQYRSFTDHRIRMRHDDTSLWWIQLITGLALMFLATPHLYQMLMHPSAIGPYASADRVWSDHWWPLYLALLFCVEFHAGIGLYRIAVKWGWPSGSDPIIQRTRLKWLLTGFFLVLGVLTLAAYMKIGHSHQNFVGERYVPALSRPVIKNPAE